MIDGLQKTSAPEQVANVAFIPGILGRSMAMPDIHWGYGFPIGGDYYTDKDGYFQTGSLTSTDTNGPDLYIKVYSEGDAAYWNDTTFQHAEKCIHKVFTPEESYIPG